MFTLVTVILFPVVGFVITVHFDAVDAVDLALLVDAAFADEPDFEDVVVAIVYGKI